MGITDILIIPHQADLNNLYSQNKDANSELNLEKQLNIQEFLSLFERKSLDNMHIHEVLEKSELILGTEPETPRNPELHERVERLKAQQANAEYRNMTKGLSSESKEKVSIREDVRFVTAQITALINFVLTVIGSFFFAYKALEYALPEQNIPAQVLLGIVTSTAVAFADLFFLARTI